MLDYESLRSRSHLCWAPKQIQAQEVYLPPTDRIEFPLARAAQQALLDMSDPEKETAKSIYDRSFNEGVPPYDIGIDAFPVEDKPPPQRHAYITCARLLKHGFARGRPGRTMGHNRHSSECKAGFDAIFST